MWKRPCAWLACSSRKPSTSEPDRPNSEAPKAVAMPLSGPSMLSLSLANMVHGVAAGDLQPTDGVGHGADRLEQAPEGAEQAEEDQQADQVAREVAPFVEAGGDAVEHRARGAWPTAAGRSWRSPSMVASGASRFSAWVSSGGAPCSRCWKRRSHLHLGPQRDDLAHDEEDADHQHRHDHAVQDRRVQEHAQQVDVQHVGEPGDGRQEQQHADEIGERTAHAVAPAVDSGGGRLRADHVLGTRISTQVAVARRWLPTSMRDLTPLSIR